MTTRRDNLEATPEQRELWGKLLDYEAPHIKEKYVDIGLATTAVEADALFIELKRFLYLTYCFEQKQMIMNSSVVDAAWHAFILHTSDYREFCQTIFQRDVDHLPRRARGNTKRVLAGTPSEDDFRGSYTATFGPLPDIWYDWRCLRPQTRLQHADIRARMFARSESGRAVLLREREAATDVVCRTSASGLEALHFVAAHDPFLLRELPGLNHEERVMLVAPLVQYGILELVL